MDDDKTTNEHLVKGKPRKRKIHKRPNRKKKEADRGCFLRRLSYNSFSMMLERCNNPKHVGYAEYGGRGIHVFDRWQPTHADDPHSDLGPTKLQAFEWFLKDVGLRPSRNHTLDRIDPNGHYVPGNVRWATYEEQGSNKRCTHYVLHPKTGKRIPAATLARELGMSYQSLRARLMKAGTWYSLMLNKNDKDNDGTKVKDLKDA
jgi:hypothetical protein